MHRLASEGRLGGNWGGYATTSLSFRSMECHARSYVHQQQIPEERCTEHRACVGHREEYNNEEQCLNSRTKQAEVFGFVIPE